MREDVGSLSGVSVIKENGVITEQNLTVLLQSANGQALEGEILALKRYIYMCMYLDFSTASLHSLA